MIKTVVFDLDGTVYLGNEIIENVLEVISSLEKNNVRIIYFTNNSTKTRKAILDKLINFGLNVSLDQIYTSAYLTAIYLKQKNMNNVFLIGSDGFKEELNFKNINIVDELDAQAVVIGLKMDFTYNDIAKGLISILNGAKIIASNVDANFPVENGNVKPGTNAIVAALVAASCKNIDYIVGKPNIFFLKTIMHKYDLKKDEIWIIGDRIESDIKMAKNYGCNSILVDTKGEKMLEVFNIIFKGRGQVK